VSSEVVGGVEGHDKHCGGRGRNTENIKRTLIIAAGDFFSFASRTPGEKGRHAI
jgi:hypothetical protein